MRCFGLLVTLLHISSKTADDIVENNDHVILPMLEEETFCVIGTHDNDYNKKCWQDQVKIFLILLNLSTTKKSLHTKRQFGHTFYGQNGQVVKAMDC